MLEYHGKKLRVEPINAPLGALAALLREGEPVVAILDPGDATAYHLLIVPCWAAHLQQDLGRFGIREHSAHHYLVVVKLDQHESRGVWIPRDEPVHRHHVVGLTDNEWSQELLAWWLSHLVEALTVYSRL